MATSKQESKPSAPTAPSAPSAPAGYSEQGGDIVGTWDYKDGTGLHFIPRYCSLSDSTIDARKTSVLIFGEVVDKVKVHTKDEDGADETITAEPGDMIGVWYKPGMSGLKNLAGVKVWLQHTGDKEVGKPSPMKTFATKAAGRGGKLPIQEDNRKESKPRTANEQQTDMAMLKDADGNDIF